MPSTIHALQLLRRAAHPATTAGRAARTLALLADAALFGYGLLGQMVAGTIITYRHATRRAADE